MNGEPHETRTDFMEYYFTEILDLERRYLFWDNRFHFIINSTNISRIKASTVPISIVYKKIFFSALFFSTKSTPIKYIPWLSYTSRTFLLPKYTSWSGFNIDGSGIIFSTAIGFKINPVESRAEYSSIIAESGLTLFVSACASFKSQTTEIQKLWD